MIQVMLNLNEENENKILGKPWDTKYDEFVLLAFEFIMMML